MSDIQIMLAERIQTFLIDQRRFSKLGTPFQDSAITLARLLRSYLRPLSNQLGAELPDVVFATRVIDFGVRGVSEPIIQSLWDSYYQTGLSLSLLSKTIFCSERNIRRAIVKMPILLASQLIEKNYELVTSHFPDPMTLSKRREVFFVNHYHLTKRQAEVFLVLYESEEHISTKVLCDKLSISEAGIKKHIRWIIRKVGATDRWDAVLKAKAILEDSDPE